MSAPDQGQTWHQVPVLIRLHLQGQNGTTRTGTTIYRIVDKTCIDYRRSQPLLPAKSDFKLTAASYMSNELGERWALITVKNLSTGQRILKNQHMVATFADGTQAYAKNLEISINGGEQLSRAVQFGVNKFPIVNIKLR